MRPGRRGQSTLEYALIYSMVLMPLTFMIIFTSQILWVWHSVVEFARDGAQYAATHCWQSSADNVMSYMRQHVPAMVDRDQFLNAGSDLLEIRYYSKDPDTGELVDFSCDSGECSVMCVPDFVTVRIQNYEFRHPFLTLLGLPSVTIPDFRAALPVESAGCDPEQALCIP